MPGACDHLPTSPLPNIADRAPAGPPLGTGPPTKAELLAYYPAKCTWQELKAVVAAGDLRLLKRDPNLNRRYKSWLEGIKQKHGSIVNYLLHHRLQWGNCAPEGSLPQTAHRGTPQRAAWFTADIPYELLCITPNDWPYSVPPDVDHNVVWTKLPVVHTAAVDPMIASRLEQDGLHGFTGAPPTQRGVYQPPASFAQFANPTANSNALPAPTEAERRAIERAGAEVAKFIRRRWREDEWETAWFVNPPRFQSVPGLAHFHVFSRRKS